jgi:RNA polymerase sigma-70 factor (ECF subfamily)
VLKRVGDKNDAADITSQVFLKALSNLKRFKHVGASFSAWLLKIAHNETLYHFRKTAKQRNVIISNDVISNVKDEEGFDLENLYSKLSLALQELRTEALQLIELRFFEQRPFREIGVILDISENNAKVKTYRAIEQLRKLVNHG